MENCYLAAINENEMIAINGGVKPGYIVSGVVTIVTSGGNPGLLIAGGIQIAAGIVG